MRKIMADSNGESCDEPATTTQHQQEQQYPQQALPERQHVHPRGTRLRHRATQGPIEDPVRYTSLLCGLLAGVAQSAVFNPYDRALFLSMRDNRPFLSRRNWTRPYQGIGQSIGGRAMAGGLYFPLEHFFLRLPGSEESVPQHNLLAGTAAGAVNALLLNPLSAIKYKTWGRDYQSGMWREAKSMLVKSNNSIRPFLNGLRPTLYRDVTFGACYTYLRLELQEWGNLPPSQQWQANCVAASVATVLSGPFNYVRNVQYGTRSREVADSTVVILARLWTLAGQDGAAGNGDGSTKGRWTSLLSRLRVGWGTVRVAMGMAFGHAVYDELHALMTSKLQKRKRE